MTTTAMEGGTVRRTDVHAPSRIIPDDYEYVAMELIRVEGLGDALFLKAEREAIRAHMGRTGGSYSTHEHGGNCMVCGSVNAIYTALFYHAASNSYVRMGTDCATKCEVGDPAKFRAFRTAAEAVRHAHAGKLKAAGILADRGLTGAWAIYEAGSGGRKEEATIIDIVGKLVKYGDASDKALAYVGTLLGRIDTRAARETERAAEHAAAAPVPTGRVRVTGTVLATKSVESGFRYGAEVLKMLVKADEGFKVWGTVPDALLDAGTPLKGERVAFRATVEPSKDDPKFGFFKRPTNAARLAPEPVALAA